MATEGTTGNRRTPSNVESLAAALAEVSARHFSPSSPAAPPNTIPKTCQATYFITRRDGTCSALVEVDQLPANVRVVGIPATLTVAETSGMISLGVKDRSPNSYILETNDGSSTATFHTGKLSQGSNTPGEPMSPLATDNAFGEQHTPWALDNSSRPNIMSNEAQNDTVENTEPTFVISGTTTVPDLSPTPAATVAYFDPVLGPAPRATDGSRSDAQETKIYCSYWIRHGKCSFAKQEQGCKYKHRMPSEGTLQTMGIQEIPEWYCREVAKKARNSKAKGYSPSVPRHINPRQPTFVLSHNALLSQSDTNHQLRSPGRGRGSRGRALPHNSHTDSNRAPLDPFTGRASNSSPYKGKGKDREIPVEDESRGDKARGSGVGQVDVPMGMLIDLD